MRAQCLPFRVDDAGQLLERPVENIIHHHVIEFIPVRHISHGVGEATGDGGIGFGPAVAQALLKSAARRRQDENRRAFRQRCPYLAGALPIDLENHAAALRQIRLDRRPARAVMIVEHLRVLKELLVVSQLAELVDGHEEVLAAFGFSRPRLPRGMRYRQAQLRPPFEGRLHERSLSCTRGCGDDEQAAARRALLRAYVLHGVLASSMSSIQCLTGMSAATRRCCRQPILAVAMTSGPASCKVPSLTLLMRTASSRWR